MLFYLYLKSMFFLLSLVQIHFERCDCCFLQKYCFGIGVNLVVFDSGLGRETLCHSCGLCCVCLRYVEVVGLVAKVVSSCLVVRRWNFPSNTLKPSEIAIWNVLRAPAACLSAK